MGNSRKLEKDLISTITRKIKSGCNPDKIVLFGSQINDRSNEDSDIDLLIIKDSDKRRDERDLEIRKFLRDIKVPLDIFVYTPKEAKQFYNLKGSFIHHALTTGKVLYER